VARTKAQERHCRPISVPTKAYPLRKLELTVTKTLPWTLGHAGASSYKSPPDATVEERTTLRCISKDATRSVRVRWSYSARPCLLHGRVEIGHLLRPHIHLRSSDVLSQVVEGECGVGVSHRPISHTS